jgi:hypothetical protein
LPVAASAVTSGDITITITIGSAAPGPSSVLFNAPYYTCTTTYYVNVSGGNDSRTPAQAQSASTPWLTIGRAEALGVPTAGTCIQVAAGTYATGVTITHGGNNAANNGYVVYKCATLNGCTVTDQGGQTNNSAFFVGTNYVMIDGFVLNGGNGTGSNTTGVVSCQDINCGGGTARTASPHHHVWVINNIIFGYGEHGITLSNGEYFYAIHNTIYNNAHDCNGGAQGSGISYYLPVALTGYTPTADDQNNPTTGNTGTLFRQFIMWNVSYNNYICAPNSGVSVTDGNGIILDDWQGDQSGSGTLTYVNGGLIAFNVLYNNGAAGLHAFNAAYVSFINNSIYNNDLDPNLTSWYTNFDDNGSYGNNFVNNISVALCPSSPPGRGNSKDAIALYALGNYISSPTTTLSVAITTTSQSSITVASAAAFPNGSTFNTNLGGALKWNGSYALPGGNLVQIGSEILWVQGGWGTTTWTVQRGFNGTTAATHSSGATVTWIQDYASNNVTHISATLSGCNEINTRDGTYYSATVNKENTLPNWVNVGNSSTGTDAIPPVGANFALCLANGNPAGCTAASPAINYGTVAAPFNFLPVIAVDAGACPSSLVVCPNPNPPHPRPRT